MSDNIIVKAVAGTCVTFSFILAGMLDSLLAQEFD
jgi:hypothetical protein